MHWMGIIGGFWLTTLAWFAGLAVAFGVLARLMPCNPGMYWWKDLRAASTDFLYRFIVPLFLGIACTMMLIGGRSVLFGARNGQFWPLEQLPLWQQCLGVLLIQDVLLYWIHRLFHTRAAWKFHAVHHSPKLLDWTSTTRFHPVNNLLAFGVVYVTVLLMGFPEKTVVFLTPFNIVYSAMVHANLNWTFGPFRYLFVSPVYHRWHHTTQEQGLDKNFASTFPFLDVIFGTYYMPAGQLPEQFGNGEPDYPEDFWGQFLHPFRRMSRTRSASAASAESALAERVRDIPRWVSVGGGALKVLGSASAASAESALAERVRDIPRWVSVGGGALKVLGSASLLVAGLSFAEQLEDVEVPLRAETLVPVPVAHRAAVLGVAISADGRRIVSGGEDGTVKVWDAATGQELFTLSGHTHQVRAVAISADGNRIVSGSYDRTVKVWDVQTRREVLTLAGHTGGVLSVAISADGRHIISGAGDFTTRIWDATNGKEEKTLSGSRSAVLSVASSSNGKYLAEARGDAVEVRDARSGRELHSLEGHDDLVESVAFSADGQRIVSGSTDGTVKVWDAVTGEELLTEKGHTGAVYSAAISADGQYIVSGSEDRTVTVCDTTTGKVARSLLGHSDAVTCVAISGDGRRIISGSRDGTMRVWDMDSDALRKHVVQRH